MLDRSKSIGSSYRFVFVAFGLVFGTHAYCASTASPSVLQISLDSSHWSAVQAINDTGPPDVRFFRHEGFPQGMLQIDRGTAELKGLVFRNGTIEFDMKPTDQDIPGVQFRHAGKPGQDDAEEVYVRTGPDCRASNDCMQYAPIVRGAMLWNMYPQYQRNAPILDGWNHFKLVVNGRRLLVFVNGGRNAVLQVGKLESMSQKGTLLLRGPAIFANLTVAPGAIQGLEPTPTADPDAKDHGLVRQWEIGQPTEIATKQGCSLHDAPFRLPWKAVHAGRFGIVNLNRELPFSRTVQENWLRTTVVSAVEQKTLVQLGWLGQVWVFVNGTEVTTGKNFYYPDSERRDPDGRLSFENGSFEIPLRKGVNQIVLALRSGIRDKPQAINFYGSAVVMRFPDLAQLGLTFE